MMVHNVLLCSLYSETPDTGVKVCPGFPRYGVVEWESLPRIEHRQHRYPTIVLKTPISLPASRSNRMQRLKRQAMPSASLLRMGSPSFRRCLRQGDSGALPPLNGAW